MQTSINYPGPGTCTGAVLGKMYFFNSGTVIRYAFGNILCKVNGSSINKSLVLWIIWCVRLATPREWENTGINSAAIGSLQHHDGRER